MPSAGLEIDDAAALLFIVDSAGRTAVPMERLIDAYGLTRTEARVAVAVSSGRSVPETAAQFGTSPNTIKTHLRAVYAKTGLTGQTGLNRLMVSIGMVRAEPSLPCDDRALRLLPREQRSNRIDGTVHPSMLIVPQRR